MKFRNGFVSNSSTSSYILMVSKVLHEKVLDSSHPYVRAVVEAIMDERTFMGKAIMLLHYGGYDCSLHDVAGTVKWKGSPPSEKEIWTDLKKEYVNPSEDDASLDEVFDEYYKTKLKRLGKEEDIVDLWEDFN